MAPATNLRSAQGVKKSQKALRPVRPNEGLRLAYQRKLEALIDEMHKSYVYWIGAAYNANPPDMAQDELSYAALKRVVDALAKRWLKRFSDGAEKLAGYFAQETGKRSDAALKKILKDAGFAVEFKMTAAQRDVLGASISENVALIKSIPQQYHTRVQSVVSQAVTRGYDRGFLTEELQKQFEVTKRRAAFIARDQASKINSALNTARQVEIGFTKAQWIHSGGGKHPRPSHVKAGRDKVVYDLREGWLDPEVKRKIHPGELIGCRCVQKPILEGFRA
jgi:uncharacterized protein with gpF-like domain